MIHLRKNHASSDVSAQRISSLQPIRATLQVAQNECCLVVHYNGTRCLPLRSVQSPAKAISEVLEALRALYQNPLLPPVHLRLVLPGGFSCFSKNFLGRWTGKLAGAMASELERHCPVVLEELITATLPISPDHTWTVAMEVALVERWSTAIADAGITLEGIWSNASALVEYQLEQSTGEPVSWSNGRERLSISVTRLTAADGSVFGQISAVRMLAVQEAAFCSAEAKPWAKDGNSAADFALPPRHYPAFCAHRLQRIDPSESFNLARGMHGTAELSRRRQAPLARALWVAAVAVVVLGAANLLLSYFQQQRATCANQQIQTLWHEVEGSTPISPMPIDALAQQANTWRNVRERGLLGHYATSQLALQSRWIGALPKDVPLNIRHVRSSGPEVLIEGQVRSQTDARRVLDELSRVPGMTSDSARTSPASGGIVDFSIRLLSVGN